MSNKTQLPVEMVEEIKISAKKEAAAFIKKTPKKVISQVGLQNICAASYGAGATAYATKLHDCEQMAERRTIETMKRYHECRDDLYIAKDLLMALLEKQGAMILIHDSALHTKIKLFLYGE